MIRRFVILLSLFSVLNVSVVVYILWSNQSGDLHCLTLPSKEMMLTANSSRSRKKILLLVYNNFFGTKEWLGVDSPCSIPRTRTKPCVKDMIEVTHDKQRFCESDFVLVHGASDLPSLRELKIRRQQKPPSQKWIFHSSESPYVIHVGHYGDMFDLTLSYRVDSDFWMPYGSYEQIPFVNIAQRDYSAGKDKLVAWMVSNCGPQPRKTFVHELQKYIAVDVFGGCSGEFGEPRSCPRNKDCTSIIKRYKFYLSFENALCKDYLTEKYWDHLGEENVIPVVMGGANYAKLAIPGSYINVLDFNTVKDLADYLHFLDKNNIAYNEYFKWRQKYQRISLIKFCSICEVLSSETPKGHRNLVEFWEAQAKCDEKEQLMMNMFKKKKLKYKYEQSKKRRWKEKLLNYIGGEEA
ncbi:4-galactosyl-N-acetylglucosaminide 3-alpha-L-fucosyltransferase FUT6-like [Montipora capricornis]|uniref:4-galactosyl-N-acetylglucosaminide 3-alpha-L-fucosyltransferase FUT6-like n=1 Tax=Montipora capricornis TaxID=246305 RepID=UPI0035F1E4E1